MEATAHAAPPLVGTGSGSRNGAHGDAEPKRLLADEPERDRAIRAEQLLVRGTRSAGHECSSRGSGTGTPQSLIAWTEARSQSRKQGGVGPGSKLLPGTRLGVVLSEKVAVAAGSLQKQELSLHSINENPVWFNMAVP